MAEVVSLREFAFEVKEFILQGLGYSTDGTYVTWPNGDRVVDKYTTRPVKIERMLLLPGSTVILDDNPYSLACYFEEYGERL